MKFSLCFIGSLLAANAAFACPPAEDKVFSALEQEITTELKKQKNASVVDFGFLPSQCKSWRQKTGYAIFATPYLYESGKNGERHFGMIVAVIDEQTGEILSSINEKN